MRPCGALVLIMGVGGAATVAVAGCGASAPSPPGERVEAGRDFVDAWFWRAGTLAYTRPAASGDSNLQDLYVRELDEATSRLALPDLDWTPPAWWPSARVGDLLLTGSVSLFAYDVGQHRSATLLASPRRGGSGGGNGDTDTTGERLLRAVLHPGGRSLAEFSPAVMLDGSVGVDVVRVGRLGEEQIVGEMAVRALDFLGDDLIVMGHRREDREGVQVLARVSASAGTVVPLPVSLPAWTPSVRDPIALSCTSFYPGCGYLSVIGCDDSTPPCPGSDKPPCVIAYAVAVIEPLGERGRSPSTSIPPPPPNFTVFALRIYDVTTGETMTPGGLSEPGFSVAPDGRHLAWPALTVPNRTTVEVWDLCARRVTVQCPIDRETASTLQWLGWSADGTAVAASVKVAALTTATPSSDRGSQGKLLVADSAGMVCSTPIANGRSLGVSAFSPTGRQIMWTDWSPEETEPGAAAISTLWVADAAGGDARALTTGPVRWPRFSADGRFIINQQITDNRLAVSVIDLESGDSTERLLTDSASGEMAVGARRIVAVTGWNTQDLSGRVEMFDLVRGTSQVIVPTAADIAIAGSVDEAVALGYVVRTRFPSDRDGLWMTRLPPADAP